MNFLRRLVAFIYAVILLVVGAVLIGLAFDLISPDQIADAMDAEIYAPVTVRYVAGAIGILLALVGIAKPYRAGKKINKDRVITFQNPDGEVAVSLSAVEDYIRKVSRAIPGIRDIKPHVDVTKKGIEVVIAACLAAGANIPEITEMIQMEVRNRVQSMIGAEEKISIALHVTRIEGSGKGEPMPMPQEEDEPHIPFREMD